MTIYKRGRECELRMTEHKSNKSPERDSNPGPPDCESDALTTRPRCLPVMSLPSLPVTERAKTKKTDGLCGEVAVGSSSSFIHTYSITIQQQYGKKIVKTELTIH